MLNSRVSTLRQAWTALRRTRDLRLTDPSPLVAKRYQRHLVAPVKGSSIEEGAAIADLRRYCLPERYSLLKVSARCPYRRSLAGIFRLGKIDELM
jgi:hypothetical protein